MKNIYICSNSNKEIISVLNNELNSDLKILSDECTRKIQDNETTLSLVLTGKGINEIDTNNYILYPIFDEYSLYKIVKKELEDDELLLECEPVFIQDLNSVIVRPTQFSNATVKEILNSLLINVDYEIGDVDEEISYLSEFEIDNHITVLEALLNLSEITNSELKVNVEIGNNKILRQTISLKKKSVDYIDVFLTREKLDSMRISEDVSELCTELIVIGKGSGDKTISLQGMRKEDVDRILKTTSYYIEGDKLCSLYGKTAYGTIQRVYETECKSQAELLEKAYSELKMLDKPLMVYQCESTELINDINYDCLGQYLRIGDELTQSYVSARITELTTSVTTPDENSVTFGDYIPEKIVRSDFLLQLQEQIGKLESELESKAYDLEIVATNGFSFVNNAGQTTLIAKVTKNNEEYDSLGGALMYKWCRFDEDGIQIDFPDGDKEKVGKQITIKGADVENKLILEVIVYLPERERRR